MASAWLASRHDLKETTRAAYAPTPTAGQRTKSHARLEDTRIDTVFGDYPINAIRRDHVSDWVGRMKKQASPTARSATRCSWVRMVLRFAADEKWISSNPAADVKLPRSASVGEPDVVDDPAQFLTAAQVATLAAATPWPYNVVVHVAAWSGLRAGETAGLQVADVELPVPSINPSVASKPGGLHVARTLARVGAELRYLPPKTKGSRRRVPLTAATTALLRDYLAENPRADEPTAPLFPSVGLARSRPTGVKNPEGDGGEASGRLGQPHGSGSRRAAGARLVTAGPPCHLLQGGVPACGSAGYSGRDGVGGEVRSTTSRAHLARASAHVREPVRGGRVERAGGQPLHGPLETNDDAGDLHPPLQHRRPRGRDGRSGGDGNADPARERRAAAWITAAWSQIK